MASVLVNFVFWPRGGHLFSGKGLFAGAHFLEVWLL